jgi:hypothetical protein
MNALLLPLIIGVIVLALAVDVAVLVGWLRRRASTNAIWRRQAMTQL